MHLKLGNKAFVSRIGGSVSNSRLHFNGIIKLDKPLQNSLSLLERQVCCSHLVFCLSR
ncbi:hypothetical protein C0J52_16782 [Blattella germanica]|nr:hypothetical protein C0J52_16782 [Blattella germanica]